MACGIRATVDPGVSSPTWRSKVARLGRMCMTGALASLSFSAAAAEVFKCVEGGKTTYQDAPCRGAAKASTVDVTVTGDTKSDSRTNEQDQAKLKASVEAMERERKTRESNAQISQLEREMQNYQRAEQEELAALRSRKEGNANDKYSALWERGWADQRVDAEMQAVTEKYRVMTQALANRIQQLRNAAAAPPKAAP